MPRRSIHANGQAEDRPEGSSAVPPKGDQGGVGLLARLLAEHPEVYSNLRIVNPPSEDETTPAAEPETAFRKCQEGCTNPRSENVRKDMRQPFRKCQEGSKKGKLAKLKALFKTHYYFSDDDAIDVVLGIVASNAFDNDPIWLYLIGPPSIGKTELLFSTQKCAETYFLSSFTSAGMISGYRDPLGEMEKESAKRQQNEGEADSTESDTEVESEKKEEEYSLLPLLNGKVLVTKDFSVIHQMPREERAKIYSILRDVYDGYSSRKVGNSHVKAFHSRFNYLAGMTPDVEKNWSMNTLGERFLMYRITVEDRLQHARKALDAVRKKQAGGVREKLQDAVKAFLDKLPRFEPKVNDATAEQIIHLAEIVSTCRTYVYRDKNDDMPCLPQAELAARVAKQLMRVGQSVALVRERKIVTADEFAVMRRIALDSLPSVRRLLLEALCGLELAENGSPKGGSLKYFKGRVNRVSETTLRRELDNLAELGAVHRWVCKDDNANMYGLTKTFYRYCQNTGVVPSS